MQMHKVTRVSRGWALASALTVALSLISFVNGTARAATEVDCDADPGALVSAADSAESGSEIAFVGTCQGPVVVQGGRALVIRGAAAGATITGADSATQAVRVFDASLVLEDLTILGGEIVGPFGAIRTNNSDTTLNRVLVTGAHVTSSGPTSGWQDAAGGGIIAENYGTLLVQNSTISGNSVNATGGITNNNAYGGGIFTQVGTKVTIVGSTIAGNTATASGGSVKNVARGGGIADYGGNNVTIVGSIVTNNSAEVSPNCFNPMTSGGYNIVQDSECLLSPVTDLIGVDPLLGSLGDNGGPTQSMLPGSSSAAVDAIPVELCPALLGVQDQRKVTRPSGYECDIGAAEQAGTAVPWRQPDETIRARKTEAFVGEDVYTANGFLQVATREARIGRTATFTVKVTNDGDRFATYSVAGCRSNDLLRARYYVGVLDVTGKVNGGRFRVKNLSAGDSVVLKLQLTPRDGAALGSTLPCRIASTSVWGEPSTDAVRAKVIVR